MRKAIWSIVSLLLIVAPSARAVTINVIETSPDTILFDTGGAAGKKTAGDLGKLLPGGIGWTIDPSKDLDAADRFTFGAQTAAPINYWQEPSSDFVNLVTVDSSGLIVLKSDVDFTTDIKAVKNGATVQIGNDNTQARNRVFLTFNDSLTPDPSDMTPEPASFFLVGSGLVFAIQCARYRTRVDGSSV